MHPIITGAALGCLLVLSLTLAVVWFQQRKDNTRAAVAQAAHRAAQAESTRCWALSEQARRERLAQERGGE